jgi:uncharacterized protein YcbK (DUF882 family)
MSSSESAAAVRGISRRAFLGSVGAGLAMASPAFAATPSILKNSGDFRALSLVNSHTAERLNCVYWVEGEYVPEALEAFNYILRDWRENLVVPIDPKAIDIMSATHGLLECREPFEVVSGYRSPKTNAMLRGSSRGVAKNSYHLKGMAVDIACRSRSVAQVASAARSLGAGGVGRYSRSSFTHMDSGPRREWGR